MSCMSVSFDPQIGPVIEIGVVSAGSLQQRLKSGEQMNVERCRLLVDTGADCTCIAPDILNRIQVTPSGKRSVVVPSGQGNLNEYLVDIVIPFRAIPSTGRQTAETLAGENITILEYKGSVSNYQGLLGRDVICLGLFSLAGWDRRFTFCV